MWKRLFSMCGIAGYISKHQYDKSIINKMTNSLYHRGPDEESFYHSIGYHIGFRRLSINDVDGGSQPLFNKDKSVVLFYNGEIYNSPQLRLDLQKKGYQFKTRSDGEVICYLYEEYGDHLFSKLDGMFAIALWNEKKRELMLARDFPGEKPLYYSCLSETEIVFASELKSIVHFPKLDLTFNYQGIWDLPTFLWIPEPDTIYKNIRALMPGHILKINENKTVIKSFIDNSCETITNLSDNDLLKETRSIVEMSIKSRLLSDVKVGSFLSGGLDSSIVSSIAAKHLPSLSTFTIGFDDILDPYHGTADESKEAEELARIINTKHYTIHANSKMIQNCFNEFVDFSDQPFGVSSGMGILLVSKAAKELGVKVLLSGDGADECFGGYSWYAHLSDKITQLDDDYDTNISFQNINYQKNTLNKILDNYSPQKRAWAYHYYGSEKDKSLLFNENSFKEIQSSLRYFYSYKSNNHWSKIDYIKQDRNFYLTNEMLRKVDRFTMAHSVEGRSPFVSRAILKLANSIKYQHMIKNNSLKWILRESFRDVLPLKVINRPKHGFNVPIDYWLKTDWQDILGHTFSSSSKLHQIGIINSGSQIKMKSILNNNDKLSGHMLLCFIMLNKWLEKL